jgi:hypothetical protein
MSAAEKARPVRQLELRRGTEAVTEVLADGSRIAVLDQGRVSGEIRRAVGERKYRWQLDVSGP